MKTRTKGALLALVACFGVLALAAPMMAAQIEGPALITSAGQSPGALMIRVLAQRAGVEHVYGETLDRDALEGVGSLIIVIGASNKGLGAAGIDLPDEVARISGLLERAAEMNIPIVAMHIEGAPRRGATSDDLSHLVFSYATHAVVRDDSDSDGFFTTLASENRVELVKVPVTPDVADVLEQLYN